VHHRVDAREYRPELRVVGDIALHQFEALRQTARASGQIVIKHDFIA
jgi:hypothetical protein